MTKLIFGGPTTEVVRERCIDCNGTGIEQIPCDPDDEDCEFCDGLGYVEYVWDFVHGERKAGVR